MTKEQAIELLKADIKHWENTSVSVDHLYMAIKALERQPCDDCVSRAEVFEIMGNLMSIPYDFDRPINKDDGSESMDKIKALPPVTPTFPKGATNGDIIKAMFDCQEDEKQWGNDNIWVTFKAKNNPSHNFDLDWWNAPYKRGSENDV